MPNQRGEEVTSFKQGMEDRMAELEKTGNTRHEACAEAAEMAAWQRWWEHVFQIL